MDTPGCFRAGPFFRSGAFGLLFLFSPLPFFFRLPDTPCRFRAGPFFRGGAFGLLDLLYLLPLFRRLLNTPSCFRSGLFFGGGAFSLLDLPLYPCFVSCFRRTAQRKEYRGHTDDNECNGDTDAFAGR